MLRLSSRMSSGIILGTMLIAVAVASSSCSSAKRTQPPASTQPAAGGRIDPNQPIQPLNKHSVQTPQLEGLMKVIAMLAAENTPQTLPGDVETPPPTKSELDKTYSQAIVLADALVTAAERIPFAIESRELPAETREGFLAEANILKESARQLKDHAQKRQGESMTRSLDRINATCITCHSKYRDLSGAMDFPRAQGMPVERTKLVANEQ